MNCEMRTVKFDTELKIEAYHFQGIMQKFPNHFHEYYVVGFIEKGQRFLSCNHKEYKIAPGDLLLFNPRDNHTCEQIDGNTLDYRCINIQPEIMRKVVFEITGKEYLPYFTEQVVFHSELVDALRELHQKIMAEERDFRKEEIFFFFLEQLLEEYTEPIDMPAVWGVRITLPSVRSSLSVGSGSVSNTSRQAPAISPFFKATIRSCSLTIPPRAVLIKSAEDFIFLNTEWSIKCLLC